MAGQCLLLLLLLLLASCQESRRPRENPDLDLPDGAIFMVDRVPAATIGLDPPSEEYAFVDITGGGIVGDSLIVVVDGQRNRAGVYGVDGDFRRWIIQEGRGPGEVERIQDSGILADGRVWVYDVQNLRLLTVDHNGEVVSEAGLPYDDPREIFQFDVIGPGTDGSWWLRRQSLGTLREEGTVLRVPTELLHLDHRGNLDTVWSGGGDLSAAGGPLVVNRPGGERKLTRVRHLPRLLFESDGDGVFMAWSDSGFVDHIAVDGSRQRVGRFPIRRVPFLEEDPPPPFDEGQRALYELEREYPQIDRLLVDRDGSPWIYRSPMEEVADESEVQATLYKLTEQGPVALVRSHLPRIATTLGRDWILIERRHPATREQYVSLHRLAPVEGTER